MVKLNFKKRGVMYQVRESFMLFFVYTISVNAQIETRPYEQMAVNYFAEEISKSYQQLNYFVFDGNLETESPLPYSFCMPLKEVDSYKEEENIRIDILLLLKK